MPTDLCFCQKKWFPRYEIPASTPKYSLQRTRFDLKRKKQLKDCYYTTLKKLSEAVKDKKTESAFALSRLKALFEECSPIGMELEELSVKKRYFASEMMDLQNIRPFMVFAYSLNSVPKLIAALARIQVLQNRGLLLLDIIVFRADGSHVVGVIIKLDPIVKGAFRMYFYNPNRANVLKLDQHLGHPDFDDRRFEQNIQIFFSDLIIYEFAKITCYDPERGGGLNTDSLAVVSVPPGWTPKDRNIFACRILKSFLSDTPYTAINTKCTDALLEMVIDDGIRDSFKRQLLLRQGILS